MSESSSSRGGLVLLLLLCLGLAGLGVYFSFGAGRRFADADGRLGAWACLVIGAAGAVVALRRLRSPRAAGAPAPLAPPAAGEEMASFLARAGVPLDAGLAGAEAALLRGFAKSSLFAGFRRLRAGEREAAERAFGAVLAMPGVEADPTLVRVRALALALRAEARRARGDPAGAGEDDDAARALAPDAVDAAARL